MDSSTHEIGKASGFAFLTARTAVYAALFIGFLLIYLPARVLSSSGIAPPAAIGAPQITGAIVTGAGAALAVWCIAAFVTIGRETPAPFDAPRQLVVGGPYRFVRNPMYLGAGFALAGAALFYRSLALLCYAALFFLAAHLFVVLYEERVLAGMFGETYQTYRGKVGRWWPKA
jgi:protein-S-isoprenylcysteine O-methyltransferase Ste14